LLSSEGERRRPSAWGWVRGREKGEGRWEGEEKVVKRKERTGKEEGGRWKEVGGRRKEKGRRRKEEGGRRKEEGGRREREAERRKGGRRRSRYPNNTNGQKMLRGSPLGPRLTSNLFLLSPSLFALSSLLLVLGLCPYHFFAFGLSWTFWGR
jgi:hypothetical protein